MKAVIVTGTREAHHREWEGAVSAALGYDHGLTLIHGACGCDAGIDHTPESMRGIDRIAHVYGTSAGFTVLPMPAAWGRLGKAAGPVRNGRMLDVLRALGDCGYEIAVLAFHDDIDRSSRGTKNMIARARLARVPFAVVNRHGRTYQEGNRA